MSGGALHGVRVLDLTVGVAGPVAGMLLADLGADVVNLHRPGGGPGLSMWDRNKQSAVGQDDESLVRLAEGADVILVGTASPGPTYDTLLSLGLTPGRPAVWVVL